MTFTRACFLAICVGKGIKELAFKGLYLLIIKVKYLMFSNVQPESPSSNSSISAEILLDIFSVNHSFKLVVGKIGYDFVEKCFNSDITSPLRIVVNCAVRIP